MENYDKYKYDLSLFFGIILWLGETAYFGFNAEPINNIEAVLDTLSVILIVFGVVGSWARSFKTDIYVVTDKKNMQVGTIKEEP